MSRANKIIKANKIDKLRSSLNLYTIDFNLQFSFIPHSVSCLKSGSNCCSEHCVQYN